MKRVSAAAFLSVFGSLSLSRNRKEFGQERASSPNPVRPFVSIALLLSIALLPGTSHAEDTAQNQSTPLNQLSLEQLGNVEVTSVSKDPQEVMRTSAAIFVITHDDIERSGATSIPEALRLAPGVEVARIDADHWSISIRGFAGQFSKSLLVLIDGRTVYSLLYSGVYWDVQNVMLDDVDRIEVIRGPGGTIWGANAVDGVINIITKSSAQTHGTLATIGGGNVEHGTGAVRYGGQTTNGFNYRVYATGQSRGPEFHPDGDNFDRWRMGQMGFRTDWTQGEKDSFTVQGDIYSAESGERSFVSSFTPPAETMMDGKGYESGGNILARWEHKSGEGSDIQLQAYFDRTNRQDFELGETRNTFDVDLVQHLRTYGEQELTWGLEARLSPDNFIPTSQGVNFLPSKQIDSIYSGFVQYELPVVANKLYLTAGSKLEHNNFSGFEYEPSVRLLWTPTLHQSLWGAVTRAVRTPSRLDQNVQFAILVQAAPPPPIYFEIMGNPDEKAEALLGYEIGYRNQINRNLYVDLTGFYNQYHDLQGYGPLTLGIAATPPPLHVYIGVPYANVVEGNTAGFEIAPDWKITNWWQLRASYSFLQMKLSDRPGFSDVGVLLPTYEGSNPRNMGNFQSIFQLPGHLELDETFRYASKLPAETTSAYTTDDVRLAWNAREGFNFSVIGEDLLQNHHVEFAGDPNTLIGIKRSVYAKITLQIR